MNLRSASRLLTLLTSGLVSVSLGQPLPANHPPVGAGQTAPPLKPGQELPANHPPMGSAQTAPPLKPGQELPANHPPMGSAPTPGMPADHPPVPAGAANRTPPTADELLRRLDETPSLRDSAKTFELALSIGKLYHSNGRFADAAEYHRQAWELGKPVRVAFAKVRTQKANPAACTQKVPVEQVSQKLGSLEAAQRAPCLHLWMTEVLEAAQLRAEALFLSGQASQAVTVLDEALTELPSDPDALFTRGSILLESRSDDLASLKRAKADFSALVAAHPANPRATRASKLLPRVEQLLAAGGSTRLAAEQARQRAQARPPAVAAAPPAAAMPSLSQETIDAFGKVERTPELEQKLTRLVEEGEVQLAKGQFQQALDQYRQVMPLDPNNGRVRAGLAWAMIGLQKPAADRIWGVAVESDPAAVEKLGQALQAHGDARGAKAVWTKLAASAPDYAKRSGLGARLQ